MREILFRGKTDKGEWVEGGILALDDYVAICSYVDYHGWHDFIEIIPETTGQYTGLTDKNGKKIFEGDIVNCWGGEYAQGFWEYNRTIIVEDISNYNQMAYLGESEFIEIIGNIHDNPELLKGGAE